MYLRPNTPSSLTEAVRAWCAAHPLARPDRRRRCPACGHAGCFDVLPAAPGATARWSCFSASHDRVGLRGSGCWHGDALDLEAHRRGVSPADVLRADGFLAEQGAPFASRPALTGPAPRDPLAAWDRLPRTEGDPLDLVRYNPAGTAHVRAYSVEGRPIGIRPLEELPAGWNGATPRGAAEVLRDRGVGRWATPAAFLAGEVAPGHDLVLASDLTPVLAACAPADFAATVGRMLEAFGGTLAALEGVSRG